MANSSGGAVVMEGSGRLAGLHLGIAYHKTAPASAPSSAGTSDGRRTDSRIGSSDEHPSMETDAEHLRPDPDIEDVDDSVAAQAASYGNIGNKAYSALFIPAPALYNCMIMAKVSREEPMVAMLQQGSHAAGGTRRKRHQP